jgi:hypothetical protein
VGAPVGDAGDGCVVGISVNTLNSDTRRRAAGVRGTQGAAPLVGVAVVGARLGANVGAAATGTRPRTPRVRREYPSSKPRVRREYPVSEYASTPRVPREYTMSTP